MSSLYDAFILQEDGPFTERIFTEFEELSLTSAPRFTHVTSGAGALAALAERRYDLVVVVARLPDMDVLAFARAVRARWPRRHMILLVHDPSTLAALDVGVLGDPVLDAVLLWTGDAKVLLAATKLIEDRENVDHDIAAADVRVILVVEDSVRYLSLFLAALYPALMEQSRSLVREGVNRAEQLLWMRSRPKVLHARTFEQAVRVVDAYRDNLLALITDLHFPRGGSVDDAAGAALIAHTRALCGGLPILVQSASDDGPAVAAAHGARFSSKNTAGLVRDVQRFLREEVGFGPFVFRDESGQRLHVAEDTRALEAFIACAPSSSLLHHARRDDFAHWLMLRSEFDLARHLKPLKVSDFASVEHLRAGLLCAIAATRRHARTAVVADLPRLGYDPASRLVRVGAGPVGSTARGLAFIAQTLGSPAIEGPPVVVPPSVFIGADSLAELAAAARAPRPGGDEGVAAPSDSSLSGRLRGVLEHLGTPLIVRASPVRGERDGAGGRVVAIVDNLPALPLDERVAGLLAAIRHVCALDAPQDAGRGGQAAVGHGTGAVLQPLVGRQQGDVFAPVLSGRAWGDGGTGAFAMSVWAGLALAPAPTAGAGWSGAVAVGLRAAAGQWPGGTVWRTGPGRLEPRREANACARRGWLAAWGPSLVGALEQVVAALSAGVVGPVTVAFACDGDLDCPDAGPVLHLLGMSPGVTPAR